MSASFTPVTTAAGPGASAAVLRVAQPEPLLSRTFYQDGRLLTAADLNRDYSYIDQRLRDLGAMMGDGVTSGLALSLAGSVVTAAAGGGIAPSGRAIATATAVSADLADAGLLATLNGPGAAIADGVYAVVLLHGEQPTGIAEMFPRDLSRRRVAYDTVVDTVELALVRLGNAIPGGNALQARGRLAPSLAAGQAVPGLPPDSIALGVVAMRSGLPAWLDGAMLRHPLRLPDAATAVQDDLAAQFAGLFADIAASLGPGMAFRVADYVALLPPTGLLPRGAADPATGAQTFFPAQLDVAMTPVRADEVADILAQARGEPAVDLGAGTPAQVQILVPLAPSDYAALAPLLSNAPAVAAAPAFKPYPTVMLPRIDGLVLRLPSRQPVAATPQDAWAQIWTLAPAALPWMVRPTDGGIGGVSVGLLAAGYAVPVAPAPAAAPVAAAPVAAAPATDSTAPPATPAAPAAPASPDPSTPSPPATDAAPPAATATPTTPAAPATPASPADPSTSSSPSTPVAPTAPTTPGVPIGGGVLEHNPIRIEPSPVESEPVTNRPGTPPRALS